MYITASHHEWGEGGRGEGGRGEGGMSRVREVGVPVTMVGVREVGCI